MVTAYIMVKANTSEADRLLAGIRRLSGVTDAHIVAGDVDLIARVEVDTPTDVKKIVADGIQSIAGVEGTHTYVAMD